MTRTDVGSDPGTPSRTFEEMVFQSRGGGRIGDRNARLGTGKRSTAGGIVAPAEPQTGKNPPFECNRHPPRMALRSGETHAGFQRLLAWWSFPCWNEKRGGADGAETGHDCVA